MALRSAAPFWFALALFAPLATFGCGKPLPAGAGGAGGSASNGSSNGGGSSSSGKSTSDGTTATGASSSTGSGGSGSTGSGTPVGQFTGVNANIGDPVASLAPLGWVREYHNWGWMADNYASGPAYPNMLYTFVNFNGWDWDMYFAGLKAQGSEGFPAVQGSVPWMNNSAVPPVNSGADKTLAASYVAHADAMFQIAARYGSVAVPDAKLKLKANQTRVSGLGTVKYFENFNEQDNAAAFTPDAFAAMSSADYDGDQGRLGDTFGIKNADPNAKLVMGGLSGKYPTSGWVQSITDYLDGMRTWASANRAGSFPADVINVHLYSFSPGGGAAAPSPEADGVKDKLGSIVAYRDAYLPGKELWWTEFGYDTFDTSILRAPALGSNSAFVVQGQWLIRDFLIALSLGIDHVTLFELDDTCDITQPSCMAAQQFTTCGLIDGKGVKKAAWYFVSAFRSRLSSMVFAEEQTSGNNNVTIYQFKDTTSGGEALVVWSPTSSANIVKGYSLELPAGATTAKAVALADQQPNGVETDLTLSAGTVMLDVSETPTIVLVDSM